jgi:hypothetical protein
MWQRRRWCHHHDLRPLEHRGSGLGLEQARSEHLLLELAIKRIELATATIDIDHAVAVAILRTAADAIESAIRKIDSVPEPITTPPLAPAAPNGKQQLRRPHGYLIGVTPDGEWIGAADLVRRAELPITIVSVTLSYLKRRGRVEHDPASHKWRKIS